MLLVFLWRGAHARGGNGVLSGRTVPVGRTHDDLDVPDAYFLPGQYPSGERSLGFKCEPDVLFHFICEDACY